MNSYFSELSKLVGESLGKQELKGDNSIQDFYICQARDLPEEVGRKHAGSQLMHVLGKYVLEGNKEIPRKWNDAVEEIKIPKRYLI
jgi:hypothetical protein